MADDSDCYLYEQEGEDCDDFEFDVSDDGEDLGLENLVGVEVVDFEAISSEMNRKKPYEVDFKQLQVSNLQAMQQSEVADICGILGLDEISSIALLRAYRWNKERVLEAVMDSTTKAYEKAGISAFMEKKLQPVFSTEKDFMCMICCNDETEQETLKLSCGEVFCLDCQKRFLEQNINEGTARKLLCPGNCGTLVPDFVVKKVVSDQCYDKYITLTSSYFVDDNKYLKWCPAPDCKFAVQCEVPLSSLSNTVASVRCRCGYKFCFGCAGEDHMPCLCSLVKQWLKKCKDDSETANWIHANTKECPKCSSIIEKNGGCNHMTCRKCGHEFCWVCMGLWSSHGQAWYNCNRFEEKEGTDARDKQARSRRFLERYLHYYNRYANHMQSAKLDQELYARTELKMEEMQRNSSLSWIEVQFLKSAVDILIECRHTLKWTYALAFYLKADNQTYIFETNQQDLELATEALSGLLEEPIEPETIPNLKQQVQDKAKYVSQRRDILLNDLIKGHAEGRWDYASEY